MDRKPSRKGGARPRPKQHHPPPQGLPFSIKCRLATGCPPEAHNQSQLSLVAIRAYCLMSQQQLAVCQCLCHIIIMIHKEYYTLGFMDNGRVVCLFVCIIIIFLGHISSSVKHCGCMHDLHVGMINFNAAA